MNLPFIAPLVAFIRQHLLALAAVLLVILAAVGGYSGLRYYQYRQTAEFAFVQIKDALHPAKPTELAQRINFDAISLPLAKAVAEHYPFLKKGPNQLRDLSDMIQVGLLKQAPVKEETDELVRLRTPLYVLPPNFFTQFFTTMTLQNPTENTALIAAQIRHPVLNKQFSLLLRMDKTPEGWKLDDMVNAEELVRQYREFQMERMVAQRQLLLDKNAKIKKRMEGTLPLKTCTASAGLISDGKTLLVVVNVQSKNISTIPVNNMDLSVKIFAPDGTELMQRVRRQYPEIMLVVLSDTFDRSWTIEIDGTSPLGKSIVAARKLTCEALWKTLGLANGEVLHYAIAPDLLEEFQ